MDKDRKYCILDEIKIGLAREMIISAEDEIISMQKKYPVPEKESRTARYEVTSVCDEECVTGDGQTFYMETCRPVVKDGEKLPVVIHIHGGAFLVENRRYDRQYLKAMASRGFIAISFDYILSDDTSVLTELRNVCRILEVVPSKMKEYGADPSKVLLSADSAGAYLALYAAAMEGSEKLRAVTGLDAPDIHFTALVLNSGMFYLDRPDPVGFYMSRLCCSMNREDREFEKYADPENEEVIKYLPAVFLTTCRGDFMNGYTLSYHEALKKAGRKSHLVYLGSNDELDHAFTTTMPYHRDSIDVLDKMTEWFEEQVKEAKREKKALDKINTRIESGEIIEQKAWKYIKELNSYSNVRLDSTALTDGKREYTYRRMFRKWESYAEVFSALGITGKAHARALMRGLHAIEAVNCMYALDMTGASVSIHLDMDANDFGHLKAMIENENITDLILFDFQLKRKYLKQIMAEKEDLGIRNVIVVHVPSTDSREERDTIRRYRELRKIDRVLLMDDLLEEYEAYPISYGESGRDDAFITHTSGTTTGTRKPIPVSDRGANETSRRLLADDRFRGYTGRVKTSPLLGLGSAYALYDELMMPLAFGGKVLLMPSGMFSMETMVPKMNSHLSVLFAGPMMMDILMKIPFLPDFSDLDFVFLGGAYVSADAKKKYNRYLRKCGSKAKVCVGYGLSEAGGAVILADPERKDEAIGYPMDGIKIKLYDEDEKKFYDLSDGPHTGVMFINNPSVSCGRIDDNVIFELEDIDGEKYLNTYDLVTVGEDGALYYTGRMNKFFVNNKGVRFDAGLVERAVSAQPGIESCGMVPGYQKLLRDTVPVLYVKPVMPAERAKHAVIEALKGAFITEGAIRETNLPSECVITDEIPYNASGKVDVHQIATENVDGYRYNVIPVRKDGVLKDIRLVKYARSYFTERGVPEELENAR